MVEKAKKLIFEGEIFQVVLSRIFKKKKITNLIFNLQSIETSKPFTLPFLYEF